jgi:hypothetical protein
LIPALSLNLSSEVGCKAAGDMVAAANITWEKLGQWWMGGWDAEKPSKDSVVGQFEEDSNGIPGKMVGGLLSFIGDLIAISGQAIPSALGCSGSAAGTATLVQAFLGFLEKYTGVHSPPLEQRLKYIFGLQCPQKLPTAGESDSAYLAGEIEKSLWTCWVRANDCLDDARWNTVHAQRTRANWQQAAQLAARKEIDETQRDKYARQDGILEDSDRNDLYSTLEFWPGLGDAIRLTQRGGTDAQTAEEYGYDWGFDAQYAQQGQKWADSHFVPKDTQRAYWRAHWNFPSVGEGLRMWHRLRADAVDADLYVSEANVDHIMDVNGVPPFWRDRIKEASYTPIGRRELRAGYFRGQLTDDDVRSALADQAMRQSAIELQLKSLQAERQEWLEGRPESKRYTQLKGLKRDVTAMLQGYKVPQSMQSEVLQSLSDARDNTVRNRCVKDIHDRYMIGDLDEADAITALVMQGVGGQDATGLIKEWGCDKAAKIRYASAAQLCSWASNGLIDWATMTKYLIRNNWPPAEAQAIVAECQLKLLMRQKNIMARTQAAKDRAATKAQRQKNAAANKAQRAAARAARGRVLIAKKREACTNTISALAGIKTAEAEAMYDELLCILVNFKGFTQEGAVNMLCQLVQSIKANGQTDWYTFSTKYINGLPSLPKADDPVPDYLGCAVGTNGTSNGTPGGTTK